MKRIIAHIWYESKKLFYKPYFRTYIPYSGNIFNDIIINSEDITVDNRAPVTELTCGLSEDLQKLYNKYDILDRVELFV